MRRSWLVLLLLGITGCVNTSRYYLPVDPQIAREDVQPCMRYKYGYGVIPLDTTRFLKVNLSPDDNGIRVHLSTTLKVAEKLRLGEPQVMLKSKNGQVFTGLFSDWRSEVRMAGGKPAYEETVPATDPIVGKDRKLSEALTRSMGYNLFHTSALIPAEHESSFLMVLPSIQTEKSLVHVDPMEVVLKTDTTYFSCLQ